MMKRAGWVAAGLAALLFAGAAQAAEVSCQSMVDGARLLQAWRYPKALKYEVTVTNAGAATVPLRTEDTVARTWQLAVAGPADFVLGEGEQTHFSRELWITSEAQCLQYAALDGLADRFIDATFRLSWPGGGAQCSARIVCPVQLPPSWRCGENGQGAQNSDGRCLQGGNGALNGRGGPEWNGGGNGQGVTNGRGGEDWKGAAHGKGAEQGRNGVEWKTGGNQKDDGEGA